jgi:Cu/Zn superoxide dismutase
VRYVAQPVERIAYRRPAPVAYKPAAAPASYGGASYYQGDSLYYEGDSQPTWGYRKGSGMGIYDMPRRTKALIANDGYRVKRRTNVGERTYESINAKCILMDPDYESDVYGTIRLTQLGRAKGTTIWADIQGLDAYAQYDLSINALGDLTDGCDSAGGVFNPFVSKSGYGHWKEPETAPGALGEIKIGQYGAEVDIKADVDLSGTHSIIGRSMVISSQGSEDSYGKKVEGRRVGCCTIGLAAGKKRVAPK